MLTSEEVNIRGKIQTIAVPEGIHGKIWSYRFHAEEKQIVTVDLLGELPGHVAADPRRLAVFGD